MKRLLIFLSLLLVTTANAQIDTTLQREILESGFIHKPLKVHEEHSVEARALTKKVVDSRVLCDMEDLAGWTHSGLGSISLTTERSIDGTHSLRLETPTMKDSFLGWGMGRGNAIATLPIDSEDWTRYNRIHLHIYPSCEGMRSIYLNIAFKNEGEIKVPDQFEREGIHEINLKNNQWNDCTLEFPELPRDKVTEVKLWFEVFGQELTMGETMRADIDNIVLETVEDPEVAKGWQPATGRIVVSNTGYTTKATKRAVMNLLQNAACFELVDCASGKTVFTKRITDEDNVNGSFRIADFTEFTTPGQYKVKVAETESYTFRIDDNVWDDSAWRVLNFIFCERCGYPVPGKHGTCHSDLHALYEGKVYPLHGGWHDAGDMAQQTLQSGEISYSLLQMAQKARKKGNETLYQRLLEEAMWGMDFVLRSRLGNGYRVNAWGTNLWTDGVLNSADDSTTRRLLDVNDGAYENFMLAGIEAYTAMVIEDDPEMVVKLGKTAEEDFAFAQERYGKYGYQELQMIRTGHAKNTPESQYNASVSWAASMLYKLTGESKYAEEAVKFIQLPLDCQRTEPVGGGISGFFYGDKERKSGVHYNHKSRDYAFAEALAALCETQPEHPEFQRWMNSLRLYGEYLKKVMVYCEPYGMAPSGVYNIHEVDYPELFFPWQLGAKRGEEREIYYAQLSNGIKLDDEYYLRRFPVWYSFRGNTLVSLSTGKAAAICGRVLGDAELMDIAEKQLAWAVGFNPFGQSIIYGEGANWGQQYNALPGEMVGEIPLGFQAYGNEDEPYWPQFNTATYKEVFGLSASRWLMLVSEF